MQVAPMPAAAPRVSDRLRARTSAFAVALLGCVVAGVAAAMIWLAVAPHVEIIRVDQGFVYADSEPEQAVAADGWFALLGLAAGLLVAGLAWALLRKHRGMAVLAGLVLGSLIGAWLGWWLAVRIEEDHFQALANTVPIGAHLQAPLSLRMTDLSRTQLWPPKINGVAVCQALAAAALYTVLAGFATDPDLRPGPQPEIPPLPPLPGEAPAWPYGQSVPMQAEDGISSDPGGPADRPD
jgi:hypothetical protein